MKQPRTGSTGASKSALVRPLSDQRTTTARPPSPDAGQQNSARPFERIFIERDSDSLIREAGGNPHTQPQAAPIADVLELRSPTSIMPPFLSPSLPPLLPAAAPGSSVLPLAAETARRSAWRDEVNAQEKDLNLLAAQIKRILDEEARRHGIDV